MDPITIGLGVVGLGLQLFGGYQQSEISSQNAQISAGIARDEQGINEQKRIAMELQGKRQMMEVFRNQQRLRAQATAAAVNQGAFLGSGLQGGLAQIDAQSDTNALGINNSLETGRNIFSLTNDISSKRAQQSYLQAEAAQAQGLQSLGGALVKVGPTIGAWGKDLGASTSGGINGFGFLMGGGSPSGYGR